MSMFMLTIMITITIATTIMTMTMIMILIIKITISSNLIGSFNTLFFLNLISEERPITKCCYWTPVIGQLNKPITTGASGFLTKHQIVTIVVSSPLTVVMIPDVVPKSRFGGSRTKKQGRGEGKGEEETRFGKIRLRGPESGPRVNCACPKSAMLSCVQYSYRVRYRVAFCFKKRRSLNLKPKTQALTCFEGCSAAGQHVLAVLLTGYGKNWSDLRAVAAKHVGNRNVSVF